MEKRVEKSRAVNQYGDGVSWFRGSIIGKGGFGCVYLATLKKPRSRYSSFPSVMAVKSAEVSVSGSIQKEREVFSNVRGCPDIIRCYGEETTVGDNGVMVYNLLLEYGSGGTLADKIRRSDGRGLAESDVKFFTRSILRGLSHIHRLGYVHCDLKPDNVLLVGGKGVFRAKIGDLGLAKRGKQQGINNNKKKRNLVEKYDWRGTPMYLSPEVVVEDEQEAPSDVWALGCIVLEMLTGKPPWTGGGEMNADDIFKKIGPGRELPNIPSGVSEAARDFLKGCFVRRSMFRLTADMLLNHPFVEGLRVDEDQDEDEEVEEIEDLNEIESILLVSESDDEYSFDSFGYWSDEDGENAEDEIVSSVLEEIEDVEFSLANKKSRKIMTQVSSGCYPVSFTVRAGV